ncbi:MAG: amidohydrolase [Haloarculaceae archaeon]
MTAPADLVLTGAEVHTLGTLDETHEAVAVRDGRIARVGRADEVRFLCGVETEVIDLGGQVLFPGFVDVRTDLVAAGQALAHADLSGAPPAVCVERLRAAPDGEWLLGFGYDDGRTDARPLVRADLDRVSEDRPVAVFYADCGAACLNSVALARLREDLPEADVRTEDGDPTGVVVGAALDAVRDATAPSPAEVPDLVRTARDWAVSHGLTCVHDAVRDGRAPRVYRDLARADDLGLRIRLIHRASHLDALLAVGARTGDDEGLVATGAVEVAADGRLGARTAKLRTPYDDGTDDGQWVASPDRLRALVARADREGFQVSVRAAGDRAVEVALDALADASDRRHRIEGAELLDDALLDRLAAADVVAAVRPGALQWAGADGRYAQCLGDRWRTTNRVADLLARDVPLAFGSDCAPPDPLFGVQQAVTAPAAGQRLSVTEALRVATAGGAYAGFDEARLGRIEPGARADFVALADSPWSVPVGDLAAVDVALTVVDGDVVYDGRA